MKFSKRKIVVGAAVTAMLAGAVGAYAYFTTTGTGSGTGQGGSASAITVNSASTTPDYSSGDGNLYPGTNVTVHFTAINSSPGTQRVGTVSLTTWSSNKANCDPTDLPNSFSMTPVVENQTIAAGAGTQTPLTNTGTVNFLDSGDQSACEGALFTFNYSSN